MTVISSRPQLETGKLWKEVVQAASPTAVNEYEKLLAKITIDHVSQVKTQCFIYDDSYFLSLIFYIQSSQNHDEQQKTHLEDLLIDHADQISVSADELRKLLKFERPLGFHNVPIIEPGCDMLMFQFRSEDKNTAHDG